MHFYYLPFLKVCRNLLLFSFGNFKPSTSFEWCLSQRIELLISLSTSVLPLYSYSNQNHCAGYVNKTRLTFQPKWVICMNSLISNTKKEYYFLNHESCMWLLYTYDRESKITRVFLSSPWTTGLKARLFLFTYIKFFLFICIS